MSITEVQAVKVHVDNADEIGQHVRATPTQEKEPEHFTASTFILPPPGLLASPGGQAVLPTQILQLDPLRKSAVLTFNGNGQVILAHSQQQAQSLQSNVQVAADEGALITCPGAIRVDGTGPLWAVGILGATSAGSGVSASNSGEVTGPGASATIAGTGNLTGTYQITATVYVDGTITAADGDNMQFVSPGSTGKIVYPSTAIVPVTYTYTEVCNNQSLTVKSIAAGGAAAVYHATIVYTQIAGPGSGNVVSVGVVQERRNR